MKTVGNRPVFKKEAGKASRHTEEPYTHCIWSTWLIAVAVRKIEF